MLKDKRKNKRNAKKSIGSHNQVVSKKKKKRIIMVNKEETEVVVAIDKEKQI